MLFYIKISYPANLHVKKWIEKNKNKQNMLNMNRKNNWTESYQYFSYFSPNLTV